MDGGVIQTHLSENTLRKNFCRLMNFIIDYCFRSCFQWRQLIKFSWFLERAVETTIFIMNFILNTLIIFSTNKKRVLIHSSIFFSESRCQAKIHFLYWDIAYFHLQVFTNLLRFQSRFIHNQVQIWDNIFGKAIWKADYFC